MNILFHLESITERGGTLSRIPLMESNEKVLGNKSFVACSKNSIEDQEILCMIEKRFETCRYSSGEELEEFLLKKKIDWIYCHVHGKKQDLPSKICPTFVHAVFTTKSPFGTIYAGISPWLNYHNRTNFPVLPLIVSRFPGDISNLRGELNIPESATVFGGIGGRSSFNIPFAKKIVEDVAKNDSDIYFVFVNFKKFCNLPNVIFLPKCTDVNYKERFINTCDAMIHARGDGETFGMACAEFSIKNKPVITWKPGVFYYVLFGASYVLRNTPIKKWLPESLWGIRPLDSYAKAHLEFLGDKAITYTTQTDLKQILTNFQEYMIYDDYDCYSDKFSETKVMRIFDDLLAEKGNEHPN